MNEQRTGSDHSAQALVQEKTGGPAMQVVAVAQVNQSDLVQCIWHDETNEAVVGTFRPEELVGIPALQRR